MARHVARLVRTLAFFLQTTMAWRLFRLANRIDPPTYRPPVDSGRTRRVAARKVTRP